jgi:hypothetical protein
VSDQDKKRLILGQKQGISLPAPSRTAPAELYRFDSIEQNFDDEEEGGGTGGQTGEIEFRYQDAMSVAKRDDLLPPGEIKRLLIVHKDVHKLRVDNQKALREQRAVLKEGKYVAPTVAQQLAAGRGGGRSSPYKTHRLTQHAQFSGMVDQKMVGIPSENNAETNPEMKDKLENRLELGNKLTARPQFHPKPRPPG